MKSEVDVLKKKSSKAFQKIKAPNNSLKKVINKSKELLKTIKKVSELNAKARAKTDESIKKYLLRLKLKKKMIEKLMKYLKNITQKKHKGRLKK